MPDLTPRQRREVAYHAEFSARMREQSRPLKHEVIVKPGRKWWNHYWVAYSILLREGLQDRTLLVPGCGAGVDAIRCAKLGAYVHATDLSPHMLEIAEESARVEGVNIEFRCMPLEHMEYPDNTFDLIFVRDPTPSLRD